MLFVACLYLETMNILCIIVWYLFNFNFQVLFSHKEPPLELMDTDARVGDNISYVTFGKFFETFCIFYFDKSQSQK